MSGYPIPSCLHDAYTSIADGHHFVTIIPLADEVVLLRSKHRTRLDRKERALAYHPKGAVRVAFLLGGITAIVDEIGINR